MAKKHMIINHTIKSVFINRNLPTLMNTKKVIFCYKKLIMMYSQLFNNGN